MMSWLHLGWEGGLAQLPVLTAVPLCPSACCADAGLGVRAAGGHPAPPQPDGANPVQEGASWQLFCFSCSSSSV